MPFAAIYIPNFILQSLLRAHPELRNSPIAIWDGKPPLWSVIAASESAFAMGVQLGMAKSGAAQFREVKLLQRSPAHEHAAHAALLDLGWSFSPRVEDGAPYTIVLDLAGLASLHESYESLAKQIVGRAQALNFRVHVAVAKNIEAAILAARGFAGVTVIPAGEEAHHLGPLPVQTLAPSQEILETLESWGVRTCRELAALPLLGLSERLGQEGVRLHKLASGNYSRALILAEPNDTFEEEIELDDAVEELEPLAFILGRLLDQLCSRLNARALAAQAIRVRFHLQHSFEKAVRTLAEGFSHKSAPGIYDKTLSLPVPMRDSKMLLRLLRLRLQSEPPPAPIVKILLAAEPARPRTLQHGFFVPKLPDAEKLELTLARLVNFLGEAKVGSAELADSHRPGEFHMRRFTPFSETPALSHKNKSNAVNSHPVMPRAFPGMAFRVFRPAPAARVELRNGSPARVAFSEIRGEVIFASGPWRTSGNWWKEERWFFDDWDIAIHFVTSSRSRQKEQVPETNSSIPSSSATGGIYRIFFNGLRREWFVRGVYD